jgi:hypothetical protein
VNRGWNAGLMPAALAGCAFSRKYLCAALKLSADLSSSAPDWNRTCPHVRANRAGWLWDLTVQRDHDFYVEAVGGAVLVLHCPAVEPSGGVYTLRDPETGVVVRTGRASILAERAVTHARTPELSQFRFQVESRTSDFNTQSRFGADAL